MRYNVNSKDEFASKIQSEVVNTTEAIEILQCTRQNLNSLVKRGVLTPIKEFPRDRLFFKEDIITRKNEMDMKSK